MTVKDLTPSEAGYVLGKSASTVNRAVDTGVIRAKKKRMGQRIVRLLGTPELRFLRLVGELKGDLTPAGRRRLYHAVRGLPPGAHRVEVGPLTVDLTETDREIEQRLGRLERVKALVEAVGAGEPVLRGTGAPVYAVAALAEGGSVDEVTGDYPGLTREQVEAAVEYARAYPKRGRPYPRRSLKRMLAELDLPGEEDLRRSRGEGAGPRLMPS